MPPLKAVTADDQDDDVADVVSVPLGSVTSVTPVTDAPDDDGAVDDWQPAGWEPEPDDGDVWQPALESFDVPAPDDPDRWTA